jgi:site-specific recombinase XerD
MDTPEAYFSHFLQSLRERGCSPNTLLAHQQDWQQFTTWYQRVNQEKLQLDRLSSLDVQDYLQ